MGPFGKKPVMTRQPVYQRAPQAGAGPSVDQAINTGAMREGQLSSRITKLEGDIAGYKREMARCRPGTASHNAAKRRALQALKQKKVLDSQAAAAANSVFNLEQVKDVRDQIDFQKQQAAAIKASHAGLQAAQASINIDEIEDLQDDITDTMYEVNEISEALGRQYEAEPVDESELMAELEGFENDDFAAVSAATAAPQGAYAVPAPVPAGNPAGMHAAPTASYQPPAPYGNQAPARPYQQ